jgi:ATP-dependent protease ClpP protease subunit
MRYRFHGSVPPKPGREPITAFLEPSSTDNGVATIRLYDPIDSWGGDWGVSAKEFAAALDGLGPDVIEIHLHINSPGGEVFEGIAILNTLRNHPAKVVSVVDGIAASAASFIAMAGDEVVMGRNSELMIHDPSGLCLGNAEDMRTLAKLLDHLGDNIAGVYAGKAGGTVAGWRGAMLAETWYSADEAVAAGLADRVEQAAPAAQNSFDLSVFTYAGRAKAPAPAAMAAAPIPAQPEPIDDRLEIRHRIRERGMRVRA